MYARKMALWSLTVMFFISEAVDPHMVRAKSHPYESTRRNYHSQRPESDLSPGTAVHFVYDASRQSGFHIQEIILWVIFTYFFSLCFQWSNSWRFDNHFGEFSLQTNCHFISSPKLPSLNFQLWFLFFDWLFFCCCCFINGVCLISATLKIKNPFFFNVQFSNAQT